MARVLIKLDVRERAKLFDVLRSQEPARRVHGELSFCFSVNDDARHIGYVILEWESFRSLRKFLDSPSAKDIFAEWPVVEVFAVLALREIGDEFDA